MNEAAPAKTGRKNPSRRSLNFDVQILEDGEKRAVAMRRSFNNYVEWLIAEDLKQSERKEVIA